MSEQQQVFEFRGIDNLFVAKIIRDDDTGYQCTTPQRLSYIAEAAKSTDSSSESHFYDNKAMIVINSESADAITLTIAPPTMEMLAFILGKSFDEDTGMFIDSERTPSYFAIMYRTKGTDGKYRYVSRLKGQFSIPDEDNATEDDGTDTNNVQLTFTGIYTQHEFAKGKKDEYGNWEPAGAKGIVVDTRYTDVDRENFYSQIQTPDTFGGGEVEGIGVAPSEANLMIGKYLTMQAKLFPSGVTDEVEWTASNDKVTFVGDQGGTTMKVVGVTSGECVVTATCNGKSDTCTITVYATP